MGVAQLAIARQDAGVLDAGPPTGHHDAGESLPGGVPPTDEEIEAARIKTIPSSELADDELIFAYEQASSEPGQDVRAREIFEEFGHRVALDSSFGGVGLPSILPSGSAASAIVTPDVALAMLENMIKGLPAFKPELGVGGSSWFVTDGAPYTGVGNESIVPIQAELIDASGGRTYLQTDLDTIFAEESATARPEVEGRVAEQFRTRTGKPPPGPFSKALRDLVDHQLKRVAERRMWERIGREVAASSKKVGRVVLEAGGRFSKTPGQFTIVADATKIRIKGGPPAIVDAIKASGAGSPVRALEADAAALAKRLATAGKVRHVLRVGGKILIVVAVAADVYRIIVAEDRLKAVVTIAGGWAGAAAASAMFAAWWTPADIAGPVAWAGHGVGTLISGAVGYWIGSKVTRNIYELVITSDGTVGP